MACFISVQRTSDIAFYAQLSKSLDRIGNRHTIMGNFYLQYQYALPVFSDKALSLK